VALTWFWVVLAVALAIALPLWPYERGCGLRLVFFLGAVGVTGLVGLLAALASWAHRRGFAHVVSLGVIAWAAVVGLREALPRVGYAKAVRTWTCDIAPSQPAAPGPAQRPGSAAQPAPAPTAPTQTAPAQAPPLETTPAQPRSTTPE
jgi:hypothetical protein